MEKEQMLYVKTIMELAERCESLEQKYEALLAHIEAHNLIIESLNHDIQVIDRWLGEHK